MAGSQPVAIANDQTPVPVSGTLGVTGNFYQENQPVTAGQTGPWIVGISGTVPVSGTFWQETQGISGTVAVQNFPVTQGITGNVTVLNTVPVTGAFFQATQPISGNVGQTGSWNVGVTGPVTVSGSSAVGVAPSLPPVSVAGVDGGGLKRHILTDVNGSLIAGISGTVPVSGTFWQANQPVTAGQTGTWNINNVSGTVSLPTGAATLAGQTAGNASLTSIDSKLFKGQTLGSSSLAVVIASDQKDVEVLPEILLSTGYSPDPNFQTPTPDSDGHIYIQSDPSGKIATRAQVLTDEGSFKDDFQGSALTSTSTVSAVFTNGSAIVTGSGFLTEANLNRTLYIKGATAANTAYTQIERIDSNTQLTLVSAYTGTTTGLATFSKTFWIPAITGAGTISVGSSLLNFNATGVSGDSLQITRTVDYEPLVVTFQMSVNQRVANQTINIGYGSLGGSSSAFLQLTGTDNHIATLVTSNGPLSSDTTSIPFTIPNYKDTSQELTYRLEMTPDEVTITVDGIIAAASSIHIPGPYDTMQSVMSITNTATATAGTVLTINSIFMNNLDYVVSKRVNEQLTDMSYRSVISPYNSHILPFVGNFEQSTINTTRWDLYNTGNTIASTGNNLVMTIPAASGAIADMLIGRTQLKDDFTVYVNSIFEGTRQTNAGYILSVVKYPATNVTQSTLPQIAIGLNADPATGLALAVADGNTIIRLAQRTALGWGTTVPVDLSLTDAEPVFSSVQTPTDVKFVKVNGTATLYVNGVSVTSISGIEADATFTFSIQAIRNASTPSGVSVLTVGSVGAFGSAEISVKSDVPLLVNTEASVLPEPKILALRGKMYRTSIKSITLGTAGTEVPILFIRNPVGSGKSVFLSRFMIDCLTAARYIYTYTYTSPTISTAACTFTVATNLVTATAHGFLTNDRVQFATVVTTTGISTSIVYYVIFVSANTFRLSLTLGGSNITFGGSNGSGTFFAWGTNNAIINSRFGSGLVSSMISTLSPTISANGTFLVPRSSSSSSTMLIDDVGFSESIKEGQDFLITAASGGGNGVAMAFSLVWGEQ